ncbi:hypothetical protein CANCADRAFT_58588 [Tortispora caseinolytica NRRL Y-17796]|uniref:N-acetylglucosamine-induced protein 1 n=1 Tax=Tortispora caseinolytica NRRL Y-17796 TaxID=767744 RepID=A0A1E4TDA3_9ASCO|nr:hypothetical protein CANCADRAFT_58588 [Tortispora caseinolytica NRRL Y-17796]
MPDRDKQIITGKLVTEIMDWNEAQLVIRENRLEDFRRTPDCLWSYYIWKKQNPDILESVLAKLGWSDMTPSNPELLADPADVKILPNDFPYAIDPSITHLVVWTKTKIPYVSSNGDITDEGRSKIDAYVHQTFVSALNKDPKDVLWFRNWSALQSVKAIPHFHVLLRNVPQKDIDKLVGSPGTI